MLKIGSLLKHVVPASIIQQKLDVKGCILFTFDDGPHPEITPRVLDILEQYGARGLFFILGNRIKRAPKLLKEIIDRKHGVGNHSFTHTTCSHLSFREIIDDINKCRDEILSLTGITTKLYRPPMGVVSPSLIFASRKSNHRLIRWSLDSGEYSYIQNATSSELADNFFRILHDRAIVLSHDDNETVPSFLELILPRLVDSGFDLRSGLLSLRWNNGS